MNFKNFNFNFFLFFPGSSELRRGCFPRSYLILLHLRITVAGFMVNEVNQPMESYSRKTTSWERMIYDVKLKSLPSVLAVKTFFKVWAHLRLRTTKSRNFHIWIPFLNDGSQWRPIISQHWNSRMCIGHPQLSFKRYVFQFLRLFHSFQFGNIIV